MILCLGLIVSISVLDSCDYVHIAQLLLLSMNILLWLCAQNVQEYTSFRSIRPLAASDLGRGLQNNLADYQPKLFNLF